jgi:hypothetical protein
LHHEIVTSRMVLKTAVRHRWLVHLPDISQPYKKSSKVVHRAKFTPEEYKQLYTATRANAQKVREASRKAKEGGRPGRFGWPNNSTRDPLPCQHGLAAG